MIPWIVTASLMYGMLALFLALAIGGYTPIKVVESGGWKNFLRFSRSPRNATQRRLARQNYAHSPHGQISVLAHRRWVEGHSIISTHGGLILLAVPFQVLLATLPLAMVLMVPDSMMRENRRLELALILYVFTLSVVMKYYPRIASKYIGIASFTRKWLISMTKISWLAPVLILWLMGRMASIVVLGWIGSDINLNIDLEKSFFETTLNIGSIPETSFLDLIAALAVIPLATFTTLAVLGAGSGDPPEWMVERLELSAGNDGKSVIDTVGTLSNAVVSEEINQIFTPEESSTHSDEIILPAAQQHESQRSIDGPLLNAGDDIDTEREDSDIDFNDFFAGDFGQVEVEESHNKPSITGFKLD
jgi:hypothetical protein